MNADFVEQIERHGNQKKRHNIGGSYDSSQKEDDDQGMPPVSFHETGSDESEPSEDISEDGELEYQSHQ